ncbi:17462_t:CDS:2, partial [Dentiscutata erythropus]
LQHLEVLENKGIISDTNKEKKTSIQSELASSLKALNKLEYHQWSQQKYRSQKRQKLQQIKKQLKEAGFNMQLVKPTVDRQADERWRSELIWLIPRQHSSEEGKRYIKTVPVKLLKSQNSARRSHDNTHFCTALIKNTKEMVSLLGPKTVTYSDPTFIRICSSKHDSSTAYSHGKDFDDLMVEEKLHNFTMMDSQPKPVVVMISDGGSDKNPCYRKTVQMIVNHFIKYDLDTIIIACYALYQSAFNLVKRQMASLSYNLAGIILSHDTFGSHLDAQLKTSDEKLEKRNFKVARDVLTLVWEDTIIDSYLVLVKYVEPSKESYCPNEKSAAWMEKHVMTCYYITQVIKCNDPSCYKPFRSGIKQVLPNHFFLPLLLFQQKLHSICTASIGISDNTTYFGGLLLSVLMERKLTSPDTDLKYFLFD